MTPWDLSHLCALYANWGLSQLVIHRIFSFINGKAGQTCDEEQKSRHREGQLIGPCQVMQQATEESMEMLGQTAKLR